MIERELDIYMNYNIIKEENQYLHSYVIEYKDSNIFEGNINIHNYSIENNDESLEISNILFDGHRTIILTTNSSKKILPVLSFDEEMLQLLPLFNNSYMVISLNYSKDYSIIHSKINCNYISLSSDTVYFENLTGQMHLYKYDYNNGISFENLLLVGTYELSKEIDISISFDEKHHYLFIINNEVIFYIT